jgi:hypothetical protein
MKRYDTNGDGVLTEPEWKNMSSDPRAADKDGNGQITVQEYAAWRTKR